MSMLIFITILPFHPAHKIGRTFVEVFLKAF